MISLQRLLGRDHEFYALFEACALEACQSVSALRRVLAGRPADPTLEAFADFRRKEKHLTNQIAELLARALVVALEREDIEALANALYRIPKTVEKFAERYVISAPQIQGIDFSRQLVLMERAVNGILQMVQALRAGANAAQIKQFNANIQKIENDADNVMLEFLGRLYAPGFPALRAVITKDLYELNEKVVDRCRDAGNVITRVALKNS